MNKIKTRYNLYIFSFLLYKMQELLVKTYSLDLLWQTLKYKQASLLECFEFQFEMSKQDFKLEEWIFEFLKTNWLKLNLVDLLKLDLNLLIQTIFDTKYIGFFWKWKSNWDTMPLNAYITLMADKFHIDPLKVLDYTPEQLAFFSEWLVYNINEETPKGKRQNKINQAMKEMKQTDNLENDLKEIRELENKLKLNKK